MQGPQHYIQAHENNLSVQLLPISEEGVATSGKLLQASSLWPLNYQRPRRHPSAPHHHYRQPVHRMTEFVDGVPPHAWTF